MEGCHHPPPAQYRDYCWGLGEVGVVVVGVVVAEGGAGIIACGYAVTGDTLFLITALLGVVVGIVAW